MRQPARGESHPRARLTEDDVREIRAAYRGRNRPTLDELAAQYGITFGHVSSIVNRRTWKHLPARAPSGVTQQDADELLAVLADAHRRLDERDRERGTYVEPARRERHTPVRHKPFHDSL